MLEDRLYTFGPIKLISGFGSAIGTTFLFTKFATCSAKYASLGVFSRKGKSEF